MNILGSSHGGSRKTRFLTVLDIGSTKVVCIIAKLRPLDGGKYLHGRTHAMEVLGFGVQRSRGIKSGVVVDMSAVEQSVRLAVDAAERMSGLIVDSLIVNFSSGRLKSEMVSGSVVLENGQARSRDIRMALAEVSRKAFAVDRHIVHSLPISFSLDGETGVDDPLGMMGENLGVDVHVLSADSALLRNLELCVNRAHLSVEAMVATPFASGLAALVEDEARIGAACIDLGGGATSVSVFMDGKFVHADAIAVGGNHVTLDIARGFSTPVEAAERLKVMHGSALAGGVEDNHMIEIAPIAGEQHETQFPRRVLSRIIAARIEETLEMVRDRLNRSGYGHVVGKRIVLTGGASQLTGLPEVARKILGRNVRIGRPLGVSGLPSTAKGAAFSAAVGLLIYPQSAGFAETSIRVAQNRMTGTGGRFQRVGQWLRDSF